MRSVKSKILAKNRRKVGFPALAAATLGVGVLFVGAQWAHGEDDYHAVDTGSGATQTGTGGTGVDGGWWWDPANWVDTSNANSNTPPNPATDTSYIDIDYNTTDVQPVLGLVYDPADDPYLGTNSMTLTYTTTTSNHLYLSSANSAGTTVGNLVNSPATMTVDSGVLETYDCVDGRDGPGLLVQNGGVISFDVTFQLGASHNNGSQNGTYDYTGGTLYQGYSISTNTWISTGSSIGVRLGVQGATGTFIIDNSGSATGHAGAIVLDNYYSAYNAGNGANPTGITQFIYDGVDNTGNGYPGGIVPIQVNGGFVDAGTPPVAAEGQISIRNYGTALTPQFNSALEITLDAAPGLVAGTAGFVPQNLALFTYTNGVHALSGGAEPAQFYDFNGSNTVGLANGNTLSASYDGNTYTWAIYYNGSVAFSNAATSQISSISQTGGNTSTGSAGAIVLIGVSTTAAGAVAGIWANTTGGNWSDSTNWVDGSVPGSNVGDSATFGSAITANSAVLAGNETLSAITFSNSFSYAIDSAGSGGGDIILNNGPAAATITDSLGSHSINVPMTLDSSLAVTVNNPGDNLTISGNVSGTGGVTMLAGSGTLTLSGSNSYTGLTQVKGGVLAIGSSNGLPTGASVLDDAGLEILAGSAGSPVVAGNITTLNSQGVLAVGLNSTTGYLQFAAASGVSQLAQVSIGQNSTIDLNGNGLTVGGLSGTGVLDNVTAGGSVLLTVNGSGSSNFGGDIQDTSGTLGLTQTAGTLTLSGANSYKGLTTISGGNLVIGSSGGLPNGGLVLDNSVMTVLAGSAGSPVVSGTITETITPGSPNTGTGSLVIGAGAGTTGFLQFHTNSHTSVVSGLTVNAGSTLDIANNTLSIDFGSGTDPITSVVADLRAGYSSGTWSGTSAVAGVITSSTAHAGAPGGKPVLSVGYSDGNFDQLPSSNAAPSATAGQILVKMALAGDAYLVGTVNFNDLDIVGKHLNTSGNDWAQGNFNYDPNGATNFNDLDIVGQNLNKTLGSLGSSGVVLGGTTAPLGEVATVQTATVQNTAATPEPGTLLLTAAGAAGLLGRRRRRNRR